MKKNVDKNELVWQVAFKNYVNDNHKNFTSQNGKQVLILSTGEHNKFEGPDFKNSCIQMNNEIIICDIEFHKRASDWINHNHFENPNYNNVLLHIVLEEDKYFCANFETILLNREQLIPYQNTNTHDELTNEECKYLSTLRLLTKTKHSSNLLQNNSIDNVLFEMLNDFLLKYVSFKTRGFNKEIDLSRIFSLLQNTYLYSCICKKNNKLTDINIIFKEFIEETNLGNISKHLKQEILTNVILPIAFCVVNDIVKSQLLQWYRSAKTRSVYGILNRIFSNCEQKYIWQQQGMLEYYKNNYTLRHSNDTNYFDMETDIDHTIKLFDIQ